MGIGRIRQRGAGSRSASRSSVGPCAMPPQLKRMRALVLYSYAPRRKAEAAFLHPRNQIHQSGGRRCCLASVLLANYSEARWPTNLCRARQRDPLSHARMCVGTALCMAPVGVCVRPQTPSKRTEGSEGHSRSPPRSTQSTSPPY